MSPPDLQLQPQGVLHSFLCNKDLLVGILLSQGWGYSEGHQGLRLL